MASIPAKKRKSSGGETLTLEDVKTLGHELLSSRSHLNNLPILVSFVSPSSPLELALESLISLQSFFVPLIPEIPPSSVKFAAPDQKDPDSVYRAWLRSNFDEFVGSLIGIAISPQSTEVLRDVALDAIMDFVKLGKGGRFQSAIYHKFLQSIVRATSYADPLLDLLVPKYFKYIDVRYFTYTSIDKIVKTYESTKGTDAQKVSSHEEGEASDSRMELDIHIIYNILSRVPHLVSADKETGYEMWSQLGLSSKKEGKLFSDALVADSKPQILKYLNSDVSTAHISKKLKLKFTKAWISFLKFPLPLDVYKEGLCVHANMRI